MCMAVDTLSGQDMMAVKELKDSSHATNLLFQVWVFIG